jgi:hypothetical protein
MESIMNILAPLLSIALCLPLAATAGTFEVTGQNGGTMVGSWSCQMTDGAWTCGSQSLVTTPGGQTGSRARTTIFAPGQVTSDFSATRPKGRTVSRSRSWSR